MSLHVHSRWSNYTGGPSSKDSSIIYYLSVFFLLRTEIVCIVNMLRIIDDTFTYIFLKIISCITVFDTEVFIKSLCDIFVNILSNKNRSRTTWPHSSQAFISAASIRGPNTSMRPMRCWSVFYPKRQQHLIRSLPWRTKHTSAVLNIRGECGADFGLAFTPAYTQGRGNTDNFYLKLVNL